MLELLSNIIQTHHEQATPRPITITHSKPHHHHHNITTTTSIMSTVGPTYTRGSTPPQEWDLSTRQQHINVDAYISEARQRRVDIAAERAKAEKKDAQWHLPGVFQDLSSQLDRSDRLAQNRIAGASYRKKWEERLETAQFWTEGNLGRVSDRVRSLIGRLQDCQWETAQLKELVAKTKRELRL